MVIKPMSIKFIYLLNFENNTIYFLEEYNPFLFYIEECVPSQET